MAYDVKFLTGSKAQFEALEAKDAGTLYFITDTHEIYRGNVLFASGQAAADITSLAARVATAEANIGSTTELATNLQDQITTNKTAIETEASRAKGVEGDLTALTVSEAGKASLVAAINEVVASAAANAKAIETEAARADAAEKANKAAIEAEASRADAAEKANKAAIDILNGADTVTGSIAAAVKAEADRAKEAEKANADAIATLNGTGDGSVSKAVADGIAKVVADAPEDFDTLKEVADWISSDTTGAAKMQSDIATLKGDETTDGSVSKALKDAKDYADGLDTAMDTRVDALETAIGEGGSVAGQITAAIEALDATVETAAITEGEDGIQVKIVEVDGKLTAVEAEISTAGVKADAAADATTKANTAEANAKAYTDTALTWGTIA